MKDLKILKNIENCLKLTFIPHLVDISSAPANLKMELIELSEDNIMKYLFNSKNDPLKIWKNAIDYPRLLSRSWTNVARPCFLLKEDPASW